MTIDYVAAIRSESARFGEMISATAMDAPVPSCPEWTVADLAYHLAEVQQFWGSIVAGLLRAPDEVVKVARPADDDLPDLFLRESARLVEALERRNPGDACWSWYHAGRSVGWVRRRQAHEALIHRVDAELAGGVSSPLDAELAADGVDEILTTMLDVAGIPDWATFEPDGTTARIELSDRPEAWSMDLGRFRGASPDSGTAYDLPALRLREPVPDPTATLRGTAAALDLWLWGRGPLDPVAVVGDRDIAVRLREAAADSTQ